MNKTIFTLVFVFLLVLAAGIYYLWTMVRIEPEVVLAPVATTTPEVLLPNYQWKFMDAEADQSGVPQTTISLHVGEQIYDLGKYQGSCRALKAGELGVTGAPSDTDEVARAECWFAGSGTEIGVFQTESKTLVKVGELGEGDEETPAFRGNFKLLLEL